MTAPAIFHVLGGQLQRKGRSNGATAPTLPVGAGYVSYTDLFVTGDTFRGVLNKVPDGSTLTLPPGVYEWSDFADPDAVYPNYSHSVTGVRIPTNVAGIWGSGPSTILRMKANTSTVDHAKIPTADFQTNELHLLEVTHSNILLKNFQLQGTPQGHYYNGLRMGNGDLHYLTGATIDGVFFSNTGPGYANFPPGETFQIDANWCDGLQILNCEVDGRDPATTSPASGAGIGLNQCINSYIQDTYVHHGYSSHGVAYWRCHNIQSLRLRSEFNGTSNGNLYGNAVNHEQSDGTILHTALTAKPAYSTTGNRGFHLSFLNDDGTHTAATTITVNGIVHDAGPDQFGCVSLTNYNNQPLTIIKNGVTLTRRDTAVSGYNNGNPNAEYFLYH